MPPKTGGNGTAPKKRINSLDSGSRRSTTVNAAAPRPTTTTTSNGNRLVGKTNQSNFSIAPLILEGTKISKLELNDLLKHQLPEAKVSDIQLSRTGTFTLYFIDVISFNKVLNELPQLLITKGHTNAKAYVPRSIQRIKDTERVAFVKRVDLEIPEARITQALKDVGLQTTNVDRLRSRDGNTPTRTVKITFEDANNRNTFVRTGLQVDSMHFNAEAATHNTKPVQCYICLKYNHIAKYCKTKQQICSKCGENHRADQCNVSEDKVKCCNCNGNHIATSIDCSSYQEQEKRVKKLINQYASANHNNATQPPLIHSNNDFPPLPSTIRPDFFNEIINVLSTRMEKIIEETTQRLFNTLHKKVEKMEKALANFRSEAVELTVSDSDSEDVECAVQKYIKEKQQANAEGKAHTSTPATTTTTTTTTSTKLNNKQTARRKSKEAKNNNQKRARSPNSSFDTATASNKDPKINDA